MSGKRPLTSEEINAIVDGLDPIDWVQMELLASLSPGQRYLAFLREAEMVRADLRQKLIEYFPDLTMSEINMKVLRSLTPVRVGKEYSLPSYEDGFCMPDFRSLETSDSDATFGSLNAAQ